MDTGKVGRGSGLAALGPVGGAGAARGAGAADGAGAAMADGGYLLVVDDDPRIRLMVTRMVAGEGYPVREAASGREALALVREATPALVLLDLFMPGMSGWQFLDEYEQLPGIRPPVVVFSSVAHSLPPRMWRRVGGIL